MRRRTSIGLLLALPATFAGVAAGAGPPNATQAEVKRLLDFVAASGCAFERNGIWHDAAAARAHMAHKYEFLAARGLIVTTEDFIDKAATRSSLSGQAYQVKCPTSTPMGAGQWLRAALVRLRAP